MAIAVGGIWGVSRFVSRAGGEPALGGFAVLGKHFLKLLVSLFEVLGEGEADGFGEVEAFEAGGTGP